MQELLDVDFLKVDNVINCWKLLSCRYLICIFYSIFKNSDFYIMACISSTNFTYGCLIFYLTNKFFPVFYSNIFSSMDLKNLIIFSRLRYYFSTLPETLSPGMKLWPLIGKTWRISLNTLDFSKKLIKTAIIMLFLFWELQ